MPSPGTGGEFLACSVDSVKSRTSSGMTSDTSGYYGEGVHDPRGRKAGWLGLRQPAASQRATSLSFVTQWLYEGQKVLPFPLDLLRN